MLYIYSPNRYKKLNYPCSPLIFSELCVFDCEQTSQSCWHKALPSRECLFYHSQNYHLIHTTANTQNKEFAHT